ncbi:hypothetical protein [Deferribacter desulfuricans]|uniref:hypothetical protein n=1 Tax=Deferribacter desulfuricans TaxID=197162 RepID=UPI00059DB397|nr:hypothetical protein [Deferribacter desulfuricans]
MTYINQQQQILGNNIMLFQITNYIEQLKNENHLNQDIMEKLILLNETLTDTLNSLVNLTYPFLKEHGKNITIKGIKKEYIFPLFTYLHNIFNTEMIFHEDFIDPDSSITLFI